MFKGGLLDGCAEPLAVLGDVGLEGIRENAGFPDEDILDLPCESVDLLEVGGNYAFLEIRIGKPFGYPVLDKLSCVGCEPFGLRIICHFIPSSLCLCQAWS